MFNFFQKPVGLYIKDHEVIAVKVKKRSEPSLEQVVKMTLTPGVVENGIIRDEKSLIQTLRSVQAAMRSKACVVALPVSKCYTAVLEFPPGMKMEEMKQAMRERASTVIPVDASDLIHDLSVLYYAKDLKAIGFIAAFEKTIFDQYKKVLDAAGWKQREFVLETLALLKIIPYKLGVLPYFMLCHTEHQRTFVSSVMEGRVFDGVVTPNLKEDFFNLFQSFSEQTRQLPSHVLVSGDSSLIQGIPLEKFANQAPKFVPAHFLLTADPENMLPAGLALSHQFLTKKDRFSLLALLQ